MLRHLRRRTCAKASIILSSEALIGLLVALLNQPAHFIHIAQPCSGIIPADHGRLPREPPCADVTAALSSAHPVFVHVAKNTLAVVHDGPDTYCTNPPTFLLAAVRQHPRRKSSQSSGVTFLTQFTALSKAKPTQSGSGGRPVFLKSWDDLRSTPSSLWTCAATRCASSTYCFNALRHTSDTLTGGLICLTCCNRSLGTFIPIRIAASVSVVCQYIL